MPESKEEAEKRLLAERKESSRKIHTSPNERFKCMGKDCGRIAYFGSSGLCQMCLEDICPSEGPGG